MTAIYDREVGKLPLSIATSLAIEGMLGIHDETKVPQPYPISTYSQLWVNVKTLFRNVMGSLPKEKAERVSIKELVDTITDEINNLTNIIPAESNQRCSVHFYLPSYNTLFRSFPNAILEKGKVSDKQAKYNRLESDTMDALRRSHLPNINECDVVIVTKVYGLKILLLTHYPVDLLNVYDYSSLGLLESHTGVVKLRYRWYTKLKNGKELERIPFNKLTMQVFGDASGMFHPMSLELRRKLLEAATADQWNQNTTPSVMSSTISRHFDRDDRRLLLSLT